MLILILFLLLVSSPLTFKVVFITVFRIALGSVAGLWLLIHDFIAVFSSSGDQAAGLIVSLLGSTE